MDNVLLARVLGITIVVSPAALLFVIVAPMLLGRSLPERLQTRCNKLSVSLGLLASLGILGGMLMTDSRRVVLELGDWVSLPEEHFHFHLKFVFDRLSVPFTILSFVLCGTVGAFASVYMHREPGYNRFFLQYALFLLGMVISSLAGTIETLFFGWELVGLSSALLVAFFHERPGPVRNGQHVWTVYRLSDAAFLIAALTMHHWIGAGDFEGLMGATPWPAGQAAVDAWPALCVGLLLLISAAGKSGMVPFSGWLPRAMEGPTPSSAVFYGALSVHLGTYLLLRVSPLLEVSVWLQACVVLLGLASASFGAIASRVQTDVKNALAFASLTQVGIITVEIGLGLRYIPLIHMIGHASLRTLQLLRAPSALKDHQMLENAVGHHLTGEAAVSASWWAPPAWLFRFAHERGYLDQSLHAFIVKPFLSVFHRCDAWERRWTEYVSEPNNASDPEVAPTPDPLEVPVA